MSRLFAVSGGRNGVRKGVRGFAALILCALAAAGVAGCGTADSQEPPTLTVLAASSLSDAFGELEEIFEEENPEAEVRISYAGSSTLLAQIQQGAPADIFASADEEKMNVAVEEGLVSGEPRLFAANRMVVAVPQENPAGIRNLGDLAEPGTRVVLAQEGVPVAEYAGEVLENASAEYGEEFPEAVLSNVVSREADVRAAVNRVALGDADAAFCYASDVTPAVAGRVSVVEVPEEFNVTATYPVAILRGVEELDLAREWIDLIRSAEGRRVLQEWGFEPA